jgi:hypothetical protein
MAVRRAVCRETNVVCHQRPDPVGLNPRLPITRASRMPDSGCRVGMARPCMESLQYRGLIAPALPALKELLGTNGARNWIAAVLAVWHLGRTISPVLKVPNFAKTGGYRECPFSRSTWCEPADEPPAIRAHKPLTRPITAVEGAAFLPPQQRRCGCIPSRCRLNPRPFCSAIEPTSLPRLALRLFLGPGPLFDCNWNGGWGRIVKRILHALAAKTPIPAILSTLLTARKDAINASGVSYDAPRIAYICVDVSRRGEHRRQGESGSH